MSKVLLKHTGIDPFIETHSSLAIAHKLGGDNMGLLDTNRQVIEILASHGITQTFSVSAFRSSSKDFNTTSKLIAAGESQHRETILSALSEIEDFHTELLEEILKTSGPNMRQRLIDYAKGLFETYKGQALKSEGLDNCLEISDYTLGIGERAFSLLSLGEVIAAKVFVQYLEDNGIPAVYIDTASLKNITPQKLGNQVQDFLKGEFEHIFQNTPGAIPIIPGYIGGIEGGILAKLGRGYTDFTGAQSAIALHDTQRYEQVLLYIQKLYGFKSTDPRALSHPGNAQSVNHLSYDLVARAISHRGAGAGLINQFALSEDMRKREIPLLVGNPTDSSDIAYIDKAGNPLALGVELVLGRDYKREYDERTYGRKNPDCNENHIIYLMGDNIGNLGEVFRQSCRVLESVEIDYIAGELRMAGKAELSFVFKNQKDAITAQRALHDAFIEN